MRRIMQPLGSGRAPFTRRSAASLALCLALGLACGGDAADEARALHESGRHIEALDRLEPLLERSPDDAELHYLYGVASIAAGRPSTGIWSLRRAREAEGFEVEAGVALALAGLQSGDDAMAIEAATRVLEVEPDQIVALGARAEAYLRVGDEDAAHRDIDRAIEVEPTSGDLHLLKFRALIQQDRIDEAVAKFEDIEARRESEELLVTGPRYCLARAYFAAERGETDEGIDRFEACLEEYPVAPVVLAESLAFFDAQGMPDRSNAMLERALEQEPQAYLVRGFLAERLRDAGRVDEAKALLLAGTELEPDVVAAHAWQSLAGHHFALQEFAEAAAAWERFMQLTPNPDDEMRMAWLETLSFSGQFDRALEVAEGLSPSLRPMGLGRISFEQRRPAESLAHFAEGLRVWPDNAVARYYAAQAAERAGDFDRAISEYRHAIRAGVEGTDAGLRLAWIHLAEGKLDVALSALGHHVSEHPDDLDALALHYWTTLSSGRGKAARSTLARIASASPEGSGRSLELVVETVSRRDGPGPAAETIARASKSTDLTAPAHRGILARWVELLDEARRREEAIALVDARRAQAPESVEVRVAAARLRELTGDATEAADLYREIIAAEPAHLSALRGLARLEIAAGRIDAAVELERAVAAHARSWRMRNDALVRAAEALSAAGRDEAASAQLEELLWLDPVEVEAAARLADRLRDDPDSAARRRDLEARVERFVRPGARAG